jgi:hypothetical protein
MSEYEVRVFSLSVERRTTEAPYDYPGELGDIQTIEVGATRSKPSDSYSARYTVNYGVRDGIAEVRSVEPTERSHSNPTVETKHLGHILAETDSAVRNSVPDVEAVKPLTQSLRNERAKHEDGHPHANTDEHEVEA